MPKSPLSFTDYTAFVKSMKAYPEEFAEIYPILGLVGEVGEIAEKMKKKLRGDVAYQDPEAYLQMILLELGDPLWYITALADDMGFTLQDVVNANYAKLTSRKDRGVLKGDGDNR